MACVEMTGCTVERLGGLDALSQRASSLLLDIAGDCIAKRGEFNLAVSGGSTPRGLFEILGGTLVDKVPTWKMQVFWCDERCVPYDHPWSNYGMAKRLWLEPVGFPRDSLHPVPVELGPAWAARAYDRMLRQRFSHQRRSLDLCLLGMGADGHVASLFPGSEALAVSDRWAVAVEPGSGVEPFVERVTLTMRVLASADRRLILVAGPEKTSLAEAIIGGNSSTRNLPTAILQKRAGIHWLLS